MMRAYDKCGMKASCETVASDPDSCLLPEFGAQRDTDVPAYR